MKLSSWDSPDAYTQWTMLVSTCCACRSGKATSPIPDMQHPWQRRSYYPSSMNAATRPSMRYDFDQKQAVLPHLPPSQLDTRSNNVPQLPEAVIVRAGSNASYEPLRSHSVRRGDAGLSFESHQLDRSIRRREVFRPLELSIYYKPENRLSSLFSLFGMHESVEDQPASAPLARSGLALSFSIRRKAVGTQSPLGRSSPSRMEASDAQHFKATMGNSMPRSPPAAFVRLPELEQESMTYTRVRSAMYEKLELEKRLRDIDHVIEQRRSVYLNSRPSRQVPDISTGRLSTSGRRSYQKPQTSTSAVRAQQPEMRNGVNGRVVIEHRPLPTISPASLLERPLPRTPRPPPLLKERPLPPPPLPLMIKGSKLLPPRKTSLSRVSGWLRLSASDGHHSGHVSSESLTSISKPVTSRQEFYRCIDVEKEKQFDSSDTVDTGISSSSTAASEEKAMMLKTITSDSTIPLELLTRETTRVTDFRKADAVLMNAREDACSLPAGKTVVEVAAPVPLKDHRRDSVGVAF